MLLEHYDFVYDVRTLHIIAGMVLGLVFGVSAQIANFCLRRAVAGPMEDRASAGAIWLTALSSAVIGFGVLSVLGVVDLGAHRFLSSQLPILAIVTGGLMFGAGMVLTRGCISRLTVLSATGNLRAVFVLLALVITAHAALKGVLSPSLGALASFRVDLPIGSVATSLFGQLLLIVAIVTGAAVLVWQTRPRPLHIALAVVIGLVSVAGWAITSVLLYDEFEPLPVQAAAFTAPWSDTLFWTIASSAVPATFGVGFIGGVLFGSFASAAVRGELRLESFDSPSQTLRYVSGGVLMGFGGVLAGGCTVGAGLSGVATGSVAAIVALTSIVVGAWVAGNMLRQTHKAPATA